MNRYIFSVYDVAAGMYLEPFFAPSVEFAIRSFKEAVNSEGHQFNKFPEDYTLFQVGEWNGQAGQLDAIVPHSLGSGVSFLATAPSIKEDVG